MCSLYNFRWPSLLYIRNQCSTYNESCLNYSLCLLWYCSYLPRRDYLFWLIVCQCLLGDDISVKLGFSHLSNTCCFLCLPDECQHICFWLLVTELMHMTPLCAMWLSKQFYDNMSSWFTNSSCFLNNLYKKQTLKIRQGQLKNCNLLFSQSLCDLPSFTQVFLSWFG